MAKVRRVSHEAESSRKPETTRPIAEVRKIQFPIRENTEPSEATAQAKRITLPAPAVVNRSAVQGDRSVSLKGLNQLPSRATAPSAEGEPAPSKKSQDVKLKGMVISGQTLQAKDIPSE